MIRLETKPMLTLPAADGVPCYFPTKPDEGRSHIDAIVALMEDENPPYDPRCQVHQEAAKLFWGTAEEKKDYNRKLRRYDSHQGG